MSAATAGRVWTDVTAADLTEAVAGITLLGLLTRAQELDAAWVDRTTGLLLKGISA